MVPDIIRISVQSEQSNIPVTYTQMIGTMDVFPRRATYAVDKANQLPYMQKWLSI